MNGKTISIAAAAGGGKFNCYLSVPASGSGPGLVILQEIYGVNPHIRAVADSYAEEGYVVLAPEIFWRIQPGVELGYSEADREKARALFARLDVDTALKDIGAAVDALRAMPACTGKVATLGYCLGGKLAYLSAARCTVDAAISYYGVGIEQNLDEVGSVRCPIMLHMGALDRLTPPAVREQLRTALAGHDDAEIYVYADADHAFNNDQRPSYHRFAAALARSRSIGMLRRAIGPRYDLSALWDLHSECEFVNRDTEATMRTMVAEPYVNHVPTLTGGYGYTELYRFYKHHFIPCLPADIKVIPIARTIGPDRVVDEIMFCFTHDREIDFFLPGVAPTGRYVEVPLVAVVEFRGDKLFNEHIYWDQASVLRQLGLLDSSKLPIAGIETANKIRDESLPSNTLMKRWAESAPARTK